MTEDYGRLAYLVLLLIAVGGYLVVEFRKKPGQTSRDVLAWGLIFVAAIAAVGLWPGIRDQVMPAQKVVSPGRIEVPLGANGHFNLRAELNGTPVEFVVDTGASSLALSERDAKRIGIDPETLPFAGWAQTANGRVQISTVTLDSVEIGDIRDDNVPATVIRGDLDTSLMGMDYLRRFAHVGFQGETLVLER